MTTAEESRHGLAAVPLSLEQINALKGLLTNNTKGLGKAIDMWYDQTRRFAPKK